MFTFMFMITCWSEEESKKALQSEELCEDVGWRQNYVTHSHVSVLMMWTDPPRLFWTVPIVLLDGSCQAFCADFVHFLTLFLMMNHQSLTEGRASSQSRLKQMICIKTCTDAL